MSTIKVSTISPLGTDATKTITIGSAGDTIAGMGANTPAFQANTTTDATVNISNQSLTKVTFATEVFDTDNKFTDTNKNIIETKYHNAKYIVNQYNNMMKVFNNKTVFNRDNMLIYNNIKRKYKIEFTLRS